MTVTVTSPAPSQGRRILLIMIAITIAPVLASYLTYYFWRPAGGKTYGQLLEIHPVAEFSQRKLSGEPASLAELKGKWVLVTVAGGDCAAACQATLHALRQYRVAQGKYMGKVERLWLVNDAAVPSAQAIAAAEGARVHRALAPVPLPGDQAGAVYLIDPLGNQVIRYGREAEPVKVIKELGKFLKNNENLG
ncbi:cytochrome C oxidase subunit I [Chitinimonas arctica]|uniref:Cytochrome C oxidase subunit I n=1 Tax=Chitinimonas arctica TaxID=2594795 RepID=A0A516SH46_9NEIS|nr:cytochrome C oxidase subunit I [Chitinimonas arctica]QDQ27487.1 cytochrome C oxidase subunit I [Chitinimonas arctica]